MRQHEVQQRQLCLQELEEQLKGAQDLNAGLQQQADEYCSSVDKLEQELAITRQKHQIALQEVSVYLLVSVCVVCKLYMYIMVGINWLRNDVHPMKRFF